MNWLKKNFKTLIYVAFVVPILTVAFVSISHVTKWYGISNPISWAIYLSIGIEIAALSALAAISANMGRKVYFPFGMVTLIQFIGNIYFAYQFIDIDSKSFTDWVSLVDPIVSYLGVESGDLQSHKRFLAFFAGGMLPLISLSFLHMLVKFEEDERKSKIVEEEKLVIADDNVEKDKVEQDKVEQDEVDRDNNKKDITNNNLGDATTNYKSDNESDTRSEIPKFENSKNDEVSSMPDKIDGKEKEDSQSDDNNIEESQPTEKRNTLMYVK